MRRKLSSSMGTDRGMTRREPTSAPGRACPPCVVMA